MVKTRRLDTPVGAPVNGSSGVAFRATVHESNLFTGELQTVVLTAIPLRALLFLSFRPLDGHNKHDTSPI